MKGVLEVSADIHRNSAIALLLNSLLVGLLPISCVILLLYNVKDLFLSQDPIKKHSQSTIYILPAKFYFLGHCLCYKQCLFFLKILVSNLT